MDRAAVRGPLLSDLAESSTLHETTLGNTVVNDNSAVLLSAAAVEVEDVPAGMDCADDQPQLSRLQQQVLAALGAGDRAEAAAAGVDGGGAELEMTVESARESGVAEEHSRMEQQQQEEEKEEQQEQLQGEEANIAAVQDVFSSAAAPLPPPPPPAATEAQAHSSTQADAPAQPTTAAVAEPTTAPAASSSNATLTPEPSAYMAPLFNHIEQYRTAHTARLDQYEADLRTFDRVAVVPWLNAAVRHLRQQEEEKKELSENGARMLQEIRDFVETMGKWRGMTRGTGPRQP